SVNEKEPTGTTPPLPFGINGLASDVVNLTGTDGDVFVLQMSYNAGLISYNETQAAAQGAIFIAWLDSGQWENAILGDHGVNTTNPAYMNFQGSWAASGAGLTLGAWGVDTVNHVAWAVVDHNSDFAVTPEPASILLLAVGSLLTLKPRR